MSAAAFDAISQLPLLVLVASLGRGIRSPEHGRPGFSELPRHQDPSREHEA